VDHFDKYMRLALKAQGQCRATVETLAFMKNPPVFARQANIAHGPQQVNNGIVANGIPRTQAIENTPIKLLEAYGERLDGCTSKAAGDRDSALATVGAINRTEDFGR
jgi:hypothetical protein